MTQTLADVTERRCQHFGGHIPLPIIVRTVRHAKRELDSATEPALPELVERLARQRLLDRVRSKAAGTADDEWTARPSR